MKTYMVRESCDHIFNMLIFAKTRNIAKVIAAREYECDYIDVEIRRCDAADKYIPKNLNRSDLVTNILTLAKTERLYWSIGWMEDEIGHFCGSCERFEFEHVPESKLYINNDTGWYICKECNNKRNEETVVVKRCPQ